MLHIVGRDPRRQRIYGLDSCILQPQRRIDFPLKIMCICLATDTIDDLAGHRISLVTVAAVGSTEGRLSSQAAKVASAPYLQTFDRPSPTRLERHRRTSVNEVIPLLSPPSVGLRQIDCTDGSAAASKGLRKRLPFMTYYLVIIACG